MMRFKICVRLMGTKVNNETFRQIAEMLSFFYTSKKFYMQKLGQIRQESKDIKTIKH